MGAVEEEGSLEEGAPTEGEPSRGSALEVLGAFLGLGLTSFGGPIAHLGYYERAFVRRRRWLNAEEYASLVALCQLLHGPASSQTGFLIGLHRAGWRGAFAAWIGFTLPSALLLYAFAVFTPYDPGPLLAALLHGLKLVAVAVVAQAVVRMAAKLCPDRRRAAIGLGATVLLLFSGSATAQLLVLLLGGALGFLLCRDLKLPEIRLPHDVGPSASWFAVGWLAVGLFAAVLLALPLLARSDPYGFLGLAAIFYRTGALVFGGGHVVLPLLRNALVPSGWISDSAFLAGYGAAQAVPGPLFTLAAYVGAVCAPVGGQTAFWAAGAVFFMQVPGFLLAIAGLALWSPLSRVSGAQAALAGVNAAVVGVLGAALYDPVWTTAIQGNLDVAIALTGFLLLERWRTPPIAVVALCAGASLLVGWVSGP